MAWMQKLDEAQREGGLPTGEEIQGGQEPELWSRRAAASFLQASELTDDAVTRQSLRRRAAALLATRSGWSYVRSGPPLLSC